MIRCSRLTKMLQAVTEYGNAYRYIYLISNIHQNAQTCVKLHGNTVNFIQSGVQGDVTALQIFTNLLKYMSKQVEDDETRINIDGKKHHLRFADDAVLISDRLTDANDMLQRHHQTS